MKYSFRGWVALVAFGPALRAQSFADTSDLQLLVRDQVSLAPVVNAQVQIMETGGVGYTNEKGVVQFFAPAGSMRGYYPKGTPFEVVIDHSSYPLHHFKYETAVSCSCQRGLSTEHYDVRLSKNAVSSAGTAAGNPGQTSECGWTTRQRELDGTSHMEDDDVANDAPALSCIAYINGNPAGTSHVRDRFTTTTRLHADVAGEIGGPLQALGFNVKVLAGGMYEVTKDIEVDLTIGDTVLPGGTGELCLRPKMLEVVQEEWCWQRVWNPENGVYEWQQIPTGNTVVQYLIQGTCLDVSGLSGCTK